MVFLISDFYSKDIRKELSVANKRHDIIAVKITDPRDFELPDVGILALNDAESGKRYFVDTSKETVRLSYREKARRRHEEIQNMLSSVKVDAINISTAQPYVDALVDFFKKRKLRRRLRG